MPDKCTVATKHEPEVKVWGIHSNNERMSHNDHNHNTMARNIWSPVYNNPRKILT